jgi:hypothetical protein
MEINNLYNAYKVISNHYGARCTKRSKTPLMLHIDEGLRILKAKNVDSTTQAAWCYHPIFQSDSDLFSNRYSHPMPSEVWAMVMQYRITANAYLCTPATDHFTELDLPIMPSNNVRLMLVADKIQNQHEFNKNHKDTHPRAKQLTAYFKLWLLYLKQED